MSKSRGHIRWHGPNPASRRVACGERREPLWERRLEWERRALPGSPVPGEESMDDIRREVERLHNAEAVEESMAEEAAWFTSQHCWGNQWEETVNTVLLSSEVIQ